MWESSETLTVKYEATVQAVFEDDDGVNIIDTIDLNYTEDLKYKGFIIGPNICCYEITNKEEIPPASTSTSGCRVNTIYRLIMPEFIKKSPLYYHPVLNRRNLKTK